jgi:hypothetical protein
MDDVRVNDTHFAPLGNVATKSETSQTWKAGLDKTKGPHMITQCDPTLTRRDLSATIQLNPILQTNQTNA